uniref:Uncharacterized protein n=1 Tax=Heterorhabditis bacteriophora TaxID=37862 RepID=A0A1I7X7S5_HETBA
MLNPVIDNNKSRISKHTSNIFNKSAYCPKYFNYIIYFL